MKFELNSTNDKHAKIKMGIIPVLALVLAYVLFAPAEKNDVPVVEQSQHIERPASSISVAQSNSIDTVVEETRVPTSEKLPNISLAEMVDHDPFQVMAILKPEAVVRLEDGRTAVELKPAEAKAQRQKRMAQLKRELKSRVVGGIFVAGDKKAAVIDSKVYHEGDLLEEGIRIQRINRRNVVLLIEGEGRIALQ